MDEEICPLAPLAPLHPLSLTPLHPLSPLSPSPYSSCPLSLAPRSLVPLPPRPLSLVPLFPCPLPIPWFPSRRLLHIERRICIFRWSIENRKCIELTSGHAAWRGAVDRQRLTVGGGGANDHYWPLAVNLYCRTRAAM